MAKRRWTKRAKTLLTILIFITFTIIIQSMPSAEPTGHDESDYFKWDSSLQCYVEK